jgi:hypothetical protein
MCIDGYNDDPRELCEISEVRYFIKELDSHFPYWFYFCSPYCNTLKFLLFTLSEIKRDLSGQIYVTDRDVINFMIKNFKAVNSMVESGLINEADSIKVSDKVGEYFVEQTIKRVFH